MEWIEVNQILKKNNNEFCQDYVLDLYEGCDLGCIYCDSRSQCYRIKEFDIVKGKKDCISILNSELRNKKKKGIIAMGLLSDPYNHCEKDEMLTREALKIIAKYGFGVVIHTKSDLVLRDLDLLKIINDNYVAIVNVSISTSNDLISSKIEPMACVSSKRFEIVDKCKKEGLISGITMKPVIPFVTDKIDDLKQFIKIAHESNSDYIFTDMKLTLRDKQRDYFLNQIEHSFYGISYQYRRTYNNRYHCETLKWKENYEYLKNQCNKYNIIYNIDDLKYLIQKQKKDYIQLSLFDSIQ